jgi:hypothetical protein
VGLGEMAGGFVRGGVVDAVVLAVVVQFDIGVCHLATRLKRYHRHQLLLPLPTILIEKRHILTWFNQRRHQHPILQLHSLISRSIPYREVAILALAFNCQPDGLHLDVEAEGVVVVIRGGGGCRG